MITPLLASLLLAAGATTSPETACVTADIGKVRVLAGETEDVVARLRIGTRVLVHETRDSWKRIESGDARGWMKSTLLARECDSLESLIGRSVTAESPAEAVRWADRALLLEPFSPLAQEAAAAAYGAAKTGGVKAIALKELREGKTAVFLATCREGEATLLAQAKPVGLEPLLTTTDLLPPPEDLPTLLAALAGTSWFALAPGGTGIALEGTPFPAPAIRSGKGAEGSSRVRLGPCGSSGTLYATRPLSAPETAPAAEGDAADASTTVASFGDGRRVKVVSHATRVTVTVLAADGTADRLDLTVDTGE
jgi:hypothetical protein